MCKKLADQTHSHFRKSHCYLSLETFKMENILKNTLKLPPDDKVEFFLKVFSDGLNSSNKQLLWVYFSSILNFLRQLH